MSRQQPRPLTGSHKEIDKHKLRFLLFTVSFQFETFLKKYRLHFCSTSCYCAVCIFCIKHLWHTVRYSKSCHALIYRLSSLTCSCFIYKHDTMMIHWCINASCSAISQIKGLHTRCVILNQTRDLTCPWLMTHFRLDSSCDTLTPVLMISLLPRQRNKILCDFFFFSFTSSLNQSHQQPLRIQCEWRLPPEISCIPPRHHPAAQTLTNWYCGRRASSDN